MLIKNTIKAGINKNNSFVIRRAIKKDIPTLVRLQSELFGNLKVSEKTLLYCMKNRITSFLVYDFNGVVGFCVIRNEKKQAYLCDLGVDPRYQRIGIATTLLKEALKIIENKPCILEVSVRNRKAISLYKKFKFQKSNILPDFYGKGHSAIEMCLYSKYK